MMPDGQPERWRQRLGEFGRALELLERTDAIRHERPLTEAEEGGLVQFFELSVELGWKSLALYLQAEGVELKSVSPLTGVREAGRAGLIGDPDRWSSAIERRNRMSHTYDPDAVRELVDDVVARFLPELERTHRKLTELGAA